MNFEGNFLLSFFTVPFDTAEVAVLQKFLAQDCEAIREAVKIKLAERGVDFVNCDSTCFFYEVVLYCMDYVRKFVATWRR